MAGEACIFREKMGLREIEQLAADTFGDMVKLVVDIERGVLAVGGTLCADAEALLLEDGSKQGDIWGANYFPKKSAGSRLEYTALINIRASARNTEQYIQSEAIRNKVREVVERWLGPV